MGNIENTRVIDENTTEDRMIFFENKVVQQEQKIEELEAKIKFYEEQFRLSQAKKYGSSSEKTDPEFQSLMKLKNCR